MSANILKYRKAFDVSQTLLDIARIDVFPLDLESFFAKKKGAPILVSSLKDYNAWTLSSHPSKWTPLFVLDAKCFYYPDRNAYMIVYNEARPDARTRFSLAHELAHIVLGHLDDERTEISRGGVDDPTYYAMEGAANTFAGNFLAPPILIDHFLAGMPFDSEALSIRFDLSFSAMRDYRAEDYNYWKSLVPSEHEISLLERCRPLLHSRICVECGATSVLAGTRFCLICGANSSSLYPRKGETAEMIYPGIKLGEDDHVKECPVCKNEEHVDGSFYCMVCGKPIVNQCTNAILDDMPNDYSQCDHAEPLPGNARYCPYCGSQTTFLRSELLSPWNSSETPFPKVSNETEEDDDDDLPF